MRVPDEVLDCVVYLGLPGTTPSGAEGMRPIATGFFVVVDSETIEKWSYVYVVTARHVANDLQGQVFSIRANTVDGEAILFKTPPETQWWVHPDETVDVAIFCWAPPANLSHERLSMEMLITPEVMDERGIGAGDEVFMTGLFTHVVGTAKNLPIVRMGSIAMIPDEPIPTSLGLTDAYLIEARSIGGLSGSPAFVRESPFRGGRVYLLGLMHGHWDVPTDRMFDTAQDTDAENQRVNMGIAVVVPAWKILEVLNHDDLVAWRRERDQERESQISENSST